MQPRSVNCLISRNLDTVASLRRQLRGLTGMEFHRKGRSGDLIEVSIPCTSLTLPAVQYLSGIGTVIRVLGSAPSLHARLIGRKCDRDATFWRRERSDIVVTKS